MAPANRRSLSLSKELKHTVNKFVIKPLKNWSTQAAALKIES